VRLSGLTPCVEKTVSNLRGVSALLPPSVVAVVFGRRQGVIGVATTAIPAMSTLWRLPRVWGRAIEMASFSVRLLTVTTDTKCTTSADFVHVAVAARPDR